MNVLSFRRSLMAVAISLLAACGGGSGDSDVASPLPAPSPAPAPTPAPAPSPSPAPAPAPAPVPAGSFSLSLANDKAIVFQGGSAVLRVKLTRLGGFEGAVSVALSDLPAGVSASSVLIPAGASEVDISLLALAEAPHSLPTTVKVEGSATIAGSLQRANSPATVTVRGVAGMVDTSFAGGATLTAVGDSEDYAHAVAVQADGKVLVAGSSATPQGTRIALLRYLRDGSLDPSFGVGGKVVAAVGVREDVARAIAVQPDGRIVVAGLSYQRTADYDFTLLRFLPDGKPDTSFGNQGQVITDFGGDSDRAFALLLQPDGRIVAGGQTNMNRGSSGVDFALARYQSNGQLDSSFGNAGKVVAAILPGSTSDMVRGLALQTVGGQPRLLAVGGEGDFTAARFTDSGALDASFGNAGKLSGLFGVSIGSAQAVTLLPTGEAVIAGHVGHDFAAVQLTVDGRLDTRFGPASDGRFRHAMSSANWDEATAIARQADGRLLLGGWVYAGNTTAGDFGALRLTAEGRLDTSFGQGGVMTQAVAGSKADFGRALVLQPDERIPAVRALVAGEAQDTTRDFALLRLWL